MSTNIYEAPPFLKFKVWHYIHLINNVRDQRNDCSNSAWQEMEGGEVLANYCKQFASLSLPLLLYRLMGSRGDRRDVPNINNALKLIFQSFNA